MLNRINTLSKPVIGVCTWFCVRRGGGLACVCDSVIVLYTTKFGFTETKLGLIPATIGHTLLEERQDQKQELFLCLVEFSMSKRPRG